MIVINNLSKKQKRKNHTSKNKQMNYTLYEALYNKVKNDIGGQLKYWRNKLRTELELKYTKDFKHY